MRHDRDGIEKTLELFGHFQALRRMRKKTKKEEKNLLNLKRKAIIFNKNRHDMKKLEEELKYAKDLLEGLEEKGDPKSKENIMKRVLEISKKYSEIMTITPSSGEAQKIEKEKNKLEKNIEFVQYKNKPLYLEETSWVVLVLEKLFELTIRGIEIFFIKGGEIIVDAITGQNPALKYQADKMSDPLKMTKEEYKDKYGESPPSNPLHDFLNSERVRPIRKVTDRFVDWIIHS